MINRWGGCLAAVTSAALLLISGWVPASAQLGTALDAATAAQLDAAIDQLMTQVPITGATVGIWSPQSSYVRAFGIADKATGAPMRSDLYTRIGSVTKTFTVTGVLQLADQGKLGLDDPIAKYVGGVPEGDIITLRELARMQSGLADYTTTPTFQQEFGADPRRYFSPQELLSMAFAQPVAFPPGQGYQYSDTNGILLGLVVEKVSGQQVQDYIRDHILVSLGLSHTVFPTTSGFPDPHAQGYLEANGAEVTTADQNPSWTWAAGAMISTLDDLHTWAPVAAAGKLLGPAMQAQRLQMVAMTGYPPQDTYGLGIFNVAGWIGHNGVVPGYETIEVYLPQRQTTLVVITNTEVQPAAAASTALATAITQIISPDHVYTLG